MTARWHLRNVEVHGLIALLAGVGLHETRTATLDLHLAACLLLDKLDIVATATDNLCSQIKATNRLQTYGDLLFGPLALFLVSDIFALVDRQTYPTILVTFKVLGLATAETTFVN